MNRIRELRVQRGIRPGALAESLGVSRNTIWRWEQGEMTPRGAHLLALARLLQVAPEELIEPAVSRNGNMRIESGREAG